MKTRIIYMGTPEFAIPPLKALLDEGYDVVGVITAPDKPAGRGKKLSSPPLKIFAEEKGLKVFQPEKLKDPDFIQAISDLKPDIQIVVAFRMLPEMVWSLPKMGTFNLHASLLPQYRGAAPINWAIINGEKTTGLTTFFIDEKIDTGEVLLQESIEIGENETAGELHDKMTEMGAGLILKTVKAILDNTIQSRKQNTLTDKNTKFIPAPKIFKEDCIINWNQPAQKIHNLIRGLSPYPAAFSMIKKSDAEIQVKIFKSSYQIVNHTEKTGTLFSDGKNHLKVAVKDGYVEITELQLAGKKRMDVRSFLSGFKGIEDWRFV
ncbi:MAG: methionyl-tRNA formyltransferase [Bacteroidales bacterium]|nr:methionyl-tRNA formyltransferase [Bacteroidales bacterium]MCF8391447.1 methionyl-tRNA formyltransferase [Bacteroidales bacterium]